MGGVQRRKKSSKNKRIRRGLKTKNYHRDHDQIYEDLRQLDKYKQM
jgi:hypothetical protein